MSHSVAQRPLACGAAPARQGLGTSAAVLRAQRPARCAVARRGVAVHAAASPETDAPSSSSSSSSSSPNGAGEVELPPSLRNAVAKLEVANPDSPTGKTEVYVLGVSHVSAASCNAVKDLIRLVKPEVTVVELCKDRLGLLVNEEQVFGPKFYHSRRVAINGLPDSDECPEFPDESSLKALLAAQPGTPVATADVEADVNRLLNTGLFRTVTPIMRPPSPIEAPEFLAYTDSELRVQTVPPLGLIEYATEERVLPKITSVEVRMDSSLEGIASLTAEQEAKIAGVMSMESADGDSVVRVCLRARDRIAKMLPDLAVDVGFRGLENGELEVIVKAVAEGGEPALTGLEDSVIDGEGFGIVPFKPVREAVRVGSTMALPAAVVERMREAQQEAESEKDASAAAAAAADEPEPRTDWRRWTVAEAASARQPELPGNLVADALAAFLTGTYSKYQSTAAEKVGIDDGSAWKDALLASVEVGTQQFLLGDRPQMVSQRRLADRVLESLAPRAAAAVGGVVLAVAADANGLIPDAVAGVPAFAAVCAYVGALAYPVVGPLLEIKWLSELEPEAIEDAVEIKEPITHNLGEVLKLKGEDALLDWPGAMTPIIDERDAYMTRTLRAAALGESATGLAPGFILDKAQNGAAVMRYMCPEGAPRGAAPPGLGDGAFKPLKGATTVVGVVGSAHVRGIVQGWEEAAAKPEVDDLLQAQ